jgi:DNA/RNA endonuclease G (NUC1)
MPRNTASSSQRSRRREKVRRPVCTCWHCTGSKAKKAKKHAKFEKDLTTQENRDYWEFLEECAREVQSWPEWKRVENLK